VARREPESTCKDVAKLTGHKDGSTEANLLEAIAIGLVSVAIEADETARPSLP
jgi:hypothetical protein